MPADFLVDPARPPTRSFAAPAARNFSCLDVHTPDVGPLAGRLCEAIAKQPSGVTASIGSASAEPHQLRTGGGLHLAEELVVLADNAM